MIIKVSSQWGNDGALGFPASTIRARQLLMDAGIPGPIGWGVGSPTPGGSSALVLERQSIEDKQRALLLLTASEVEILATYETLEEYIAFGGQ